VGAIEAIVERRIAEARAAGAFDRLAGAGSPIPDLDRPREPGWWTRRFVEEELARQAADETETPHPDD